MSQAFVGLQNLVSCFALFTNEIVQENSLFCLIQHSLIRVPYN